MQDTQRWAEENRPNDDPDYQRLIAVTSAIESENLTVGPRQALNRRFDYDVAMRHGLRRAEETSQANRLENPDRETWLPVLAATWGEGFGFGSLVYTEERRGRESESFLDRIALANVNQALASASNERRTEIFKDFVSSKTLAFVSTVRSLRAHQVLRSGAPVLDHQMVITGVASHWLDGFFVGLVFQEMGGHREAA